MKTRKALAVATLAALPLLAGAARAVPPPAAEDAAEDRRITAGAGGPRVLYSVGFGQETAIIVGVAVGVGSLNPTLGALTTL